MTEHERNDLFYVCSLIEFIGRKTKNTRSFIVERLGREEIKRQLTLASVNHCLSFDEVADELIAEFTISEGTFDTVALCQYNVPTVQSIGKLYQRLIIAVLDEADVVDVMYHVFTSFISDEVSNFNSSVYYSNPDYLKHSYLAGELLA